jgi:hypothetical protein
MFLMRQVDPHLLGYTCFSFVGFSFPQNICLMCLCLLCVYVMETTAREPHASLRRQHTTLAASQDIMASCAQHIFCSASCSAVAAHRPPCSASCSAVIFLCREASPAHTRDCALSRAQMTQRLPRYLCWSAHMCNTALLLYIACAILLRDSGVLLLLPPTRRNRAIPLDVSLPCRADRRPNGG